MDIGPPIFVKKNDGTGGDSTKCDSNEIVDGLSSISISITSTVEIPTKDSICIIDANITNNPNWYRSPKSLIEIEPLNERFDISSVERCIFHLKANSREVILKV
jgi:hypothetical protein